MNGPHPSGLAVGEDAPGQAMGADVSIPGVERSLASVEHALHLDAQVGDLNVGA